MFNLNDCIAFITNSASKKLSEEFGSRLEEFGISRVKWIAMFYIGEVEFISQRELSQKMDVNESSIVRLLDRMEKEDLSIRTKYEKDRRITRVSLTEKGKALREQLMPVGEQFHKDATKEISREDLDTFKSVLSKMLKNL